MALWAKYFVLVLAVPLAVFIVFDDRARKTLATPGPYVAVAAALITMAPHLVWLVQLFKPFTTGGRAGGAGLGLAIARDLVRSTAARSPSPNRPRRHDLPLHLARRAGLRCRLASKRTADYLLRLSLR